MAEKNIDNLPAKDYSEDPRHQIKYVGSKSAIRLIDPEDKKGMERYREIQSVLGSEFTGADSIDADLIEEIQCFRPFIKQEDDDCLYTFGVSGSEKSEDSEVGELQGWINVYKDEYVPQLKEQGKIPKATDKKLVLNLAYARLPAANSGQMASGIQQVCATLSKIEAFEDKRKSSPKIIITAYASNPDSENVLNACGFKNQGEISLREDKTGEVFKYTLYVLNWLELNMIMHENANKEILHLEKK